MSCEIEDFSQLYQIVTDHLREFVDDARTDPNTPISKREADWLNALIKLFVQLYQDWQIDDELEVYLSTLVSWPAGSSRPRQAIIDAQTRVAKRFHSTDVTCFPFRHLRQRRR